MVETLDLFLKIGLDKRTAVNTTAYKKVTTNLIAAINEAGVTDGCEPSTGNLIYTVATRFPANALVHRPKLLEYIVSLKIKTHAQVDAAFCFLCNNGSAHLDISKFEKACGVGVEVSDEVIERTVDEIFEEKKSEILEKRYRTNIGALMAHVRQKQPWADPVKIKNRIDLNLFALLGEKTEADKRRT